MSEHDTTVNLDAAGYNEPARVNWRKQVESRLDDGAAAMLGYDEPWRFDPMTLYVALTRGKI